MYSIIFTLLFLSTLFTVHAQLISAEEIRRVTLTTNNGETIRLQKVTDLEKQDMRNIKMVSFHTILSDEKLDTSPIAKVLRKAPDLESLQISMFMLDGFPDVSNLPKLKELALSYNKLTYLPENISKLQALRAFTCDNPIDKIPESFRNLKNLEKLGISLSNFTSFPDVVFELPRLKELYLHRSNANQNAMMVPDRFASIEMLEELGLQNMSIQSLPPSVAKLKKLNKVVLDNNKLSDLPEGLTNLTLLNYVVLSSNSLNAKMFLQTIKKIKWHGLFFLTDCGLTPEQYQQVEKLLPKIDVYYE